MTTSTSPVGMLGLTVPSGRGRTVPVSCTTHSGRTPLGGHEGRARLLGVEGALHEPAAVAHVDEDQAAVVAAAVDPAGERDGGADVLGAQGAADVGAGRVAGVQHRVSLSFGAPQAGEARLSVCGGGQASWSSSSSA